MVHTGATHRAAFLLPAAEKNGVTMKHGVPAAIFVSFEKEIAEFIPLLHGARYVRVGKTRCIRGSLAEREITVFRTGQGRRSETVPPEGYGLLLSTGICGALASDLRRGDVVVADKILFTGMRDGRLHKKPAPIEIPHGADVYDLLRGELSSKPYNILVGSVGTAEKPLLHANEKHNMRRKTGCISVDMEDFHRAVIAREHDIPFVSVRSVFDDVDENLPENPKSLDVKRMAQCAGVIRDALEAVLSGELNFT